MKCITYQSINKCYCFLRCQYLLVTLMPVECWLIAAKQTGQGKRHPLWTIHQLLYSATKLPHASWHAPFPDHKQNKTTFEDEDMLMKKRKRSWLKRCCRRRDVCWWMRGCGTPLPVADTLAYFIFKRIWNLNESSISNKAAVRNPVTTPGSRKSKERLN